MYLFKSLINYLHYFWEYFVIKRSGEFDSVYYMKTYPDVHESDVDTIWHFVRWGWREERNPSPNFTTSLYLNRNKEIKENGINPLYHYITHGKKGNHNYNIYSPMKINITKGLKRNSIDFIIIGAQRAGTTSLFKFLDNISLFCGSVEKEVGFFSNQSRYNKGIDWYHQQFQSCNPDQLTFEATPEYLYYPIVPDRIKKYNKNLQFIVLLRDPIERCFSAWKLFRNIHGFEQLRKYKIIKESRKPERDNLAELLFGNEYPSFSKAVNEDIKRFNNQSSILEPSFVRRGVYHLQLANWFKYFDITQFLFLETTELNAKDNLIKKLSDFQSKKINMDCDSSQMPKYNKISGMNISEIDEKTIALLSDFYHQHNKILFNLINKNFGWNVDFNSK